MGGVFISFIHEEQEIASCVQTFIRSVLGSDVGAFMSADTWQVFAGERWLERIVAELKNAQVVVLMLSPESVKRPWVNFEAGAAWINDSVIIPVCFGGLTKDALPKPYSSLQAVDLTEENDRYYLIKSLAHYLGKSPDLSIESPRFLEKHRPSDLTDKRKEVLEAYNDLETCLRVQLFDLLEGLGGEDAGTK